MANTNSGQIVVTVSDGPESVQGILDIAFFGDLPEDTFESFLSAPVIARNRVVGVINVQHRQPHAHTGMEMELLTTVGEQVGCLLVVARMKPEAVEAANHVELVLSAPQIRPH